MRVLLNDWTREPVQEWPYRWLHTTDGRLFSPAHAERLARGFPSADFTRRDESVRRDGKSYRNLSRQLLSPAGTLDDRLPTLWRNLIADLLTPVYRELVAELLSQPPAEHLEIRLVRHAAGDWLGRTDRAEKRFSHIIYFNPGWRAEWGGCLEILENQGPGLGRSPGRAPARGLGPAGQD